MSVRSEGERRIRAIVRVALSPGVWLAVMVNVFLLVAIQAGAGGEGASPLLLRMALVASVLAGLLYVMGGVYHGFARGRETVSIVSVLHGASAVFGRFLWLTFKVSLLAAVLINLFFFAVMLVSERELNELIEVYGSSFGWLTALLFFAFVYWLPLVFVRGDFRLLVTLRNALALAIHRLPRSGFLAVLILTPPLAAFLLPAGTPGLVVLVINVIGALMGFIAFVYCAEWLQDHPDVASG